MRAEVGAFEKVADVVVSKYANQLPLYRQEQVLRRHGIEIDRRRFVIGSGGPQRS